MRVEIEVTVKGKPVGELKWIGETLAESTIDVAQWSDGGVGAWLVWRDQRQPLAVKSIVTTRNGREVMALTAIELAYLKTGERDQVFLGRTLTNPAMAKVMELEVKAKELLDSLDDTVGAEDFEVEMQIVWRKRRRRN